MSVSSKDFRFTAILKYLVPVSFVIHVLFIIMFRQLGARTLAQVNIVSSVIYLVCFYFIRKGYYSLVFWLGSFEVLAHTILAVLLLGWDSGFYYYFFIIVALVIIHPSEKNYVKVAVNGILTVLYLSFAFFLRPADTTMEIDGRALNVFNALNIIAFIFLLSYLAFLYSKAANDAEEGLLKANRKLGELARTDPLTGLLNRRAIDEIIDFEITRFERAGRPFVFLMSDIDDFKSINDQYGHDGGDFILVTVANLIRRSLRKQDLVARFGGEEFLLFLPETTLREGGIIAEKIKDIISNSTFNYHGREITVTMTFGGSEYNGVLDKDHTIQAADQALYRGKLQGKNCVILSNAK